MKQCRYKYILLTFYVIFLSGCLKTYVIDDLSLIHIVGYDQAEKDQIELIVAFPQFVEQVGESQLFPQILSAKEKTMKGAMNLLNKKSQKPLELGQARLFIYSNEIASKGIEHLVDSLYRDPAVRNRIYLAVSEGKAKELFEASEQSQERIGVFLTDLLINAEEENIPPTNLHIFLFSMYNDGRDAFLPLLKKDGETKVIGTALFKHDKYVEKINLEESFVLRLLTTKGKGGNQQYKINYEGEEIFVVVENITSSYRITLNNKGEVPTFMYDVKIKGEISDYTSRINLDDPQITEELAQEMEKQLKSTAEQLIKKFKEKHIDPLGLGEQYRSRTRDWQPEKWKELYRNIEVKFTFDVEIVQSGTIE